VSEIEHILENLKEFEQSEDLTHGALMRRISLLENEVKQLGMLHNSHQHVRDNVRLDKLEKEVRELRDQLAVMQNGGPIL